MRKTEMKSMRKRTIVKTERKEKNRKRREIEKE
jgi:hypothetical protein